jgi:hypothetical protein
MSSSEVQRILEEMREYKQRIDWYLDELREGRLGDTHVWSQIRAHDQMIADRRERLAALERQGK